MTVADIKNCRIVELSRSGHVVRVLGGSCTHDPPNGFSSPNGDTPLPDGGLLVTEIGGWIDRLAANGSLVWSARSPVSYPSDAQLLPNGHVLVASFTYPGRIVEMTPSGQVTWSFGASSGPNMLDKPSLAVRLPNGMIAANDDYNDRVILIDPRTKQIVWQYGHTGVPSAANGYLSKPDGIEFLPAKVVGGPSTAARMTTAAEVRVATVGHLPSAGVPACRRLGRRRTRDGPRRPRQRLVVDRDPGRQARQPPAGSGRSRSRPTTTRRCSSAAASICSVAAR